MDRAMRHEAGHYVVGRHLGFCIQHIGLKNRLPATLAERNSDLGQSVLEWCTFMAGGIASENIYFGKYDPLGAASDQRSIHSIKGGSIEEYLPEALRILKINQRRLDSISSRLESASAIARIEAQFASDPDTYEILSNQELDQIWATEALT